MSLKQYQFENSSTKNSQNGLKYMLKNEENFICSSSLINSSKHSPKGLDSFRRRFSSMRGRL